jgi:hypothetical protein
MHDPIFEILKTTAAHERSEKGYDHWVITANTVSIKGESVEERSRNIKKTLDHWREMKTFEVCSGKGWRNELYPVYSPNGELFLEMERSAACLFGVVQYGVGDPVIAPFVFFFFWGGGAGIMGPQVLSLWIVCGVLRTPIPVPTYVFLQLHFLGSSGSSRNTPRVICGVDRRIPLSASPVSPS